MATAVRTADDDRLSGGCAAVGRRGGGRHRPHRRIRLQPCRYERALRNLTQSLGARPPARRVLVRLGECRRSGPSDDRIGQRHRRINPDPVVLSRAVRDSHYPRRHLPRRTLSPCAIIRHRRLDDPHPGHADPSRQRARTEPPGFREVSARRLQEYNAASTVPRRPLQWVTGAQRSYSIEKRAAGP